MNTVPFQNLKAHHAALRPQLLAAIEHVIDGGNFVGGESIAIFEQDFARYCGARFAVGVGSGSEALLLSLLASGIGRGDEVITVPNTFIATAEAISLAGADPVFVDVDPLTGTMDPAQLTAHITPRTRGIIPVHLGGHVADMDPICAIAREHRLVVIEDACQAHGSYYKGKPAGTLGDFGCFSFYPGKNLGAFGDAGAVVTNDQDGRDRLMALREHGQTQKHRHAYIGWTARMDSIQAAVLSVKLRGLNKANAARRRCARLYGNLLAHLPGLTLPSEAAYARHNYHLYSVRTAQRDGLLQHLARQGIACGIHYPVPIHLQPAYAHLGLKCGAFPISERLARESLSLPMHPTLAAPHVEAVCRAITLWYDLNHLSVARVA